MVITASCSSWRDMGCACVCWAFCDWCVFFLASHCIYYWYASLEFHFSVWVVIFLQTEKAVRWLRPERDLFYKVRFFCYPISCSATKISFDGCYTCDDDDTYGLATRKKKGWWTSLLAWKEIERLDGWFLNLHMWFCMYSVSLCDYW